jgi:hypothetical protein
MALPIPLPIPLLGDSSGYSWTFFRAGDLDQVRMETADDYRHLRLLDLKMWVALSCPVKGLEFDQRTLALIDTDSDGHVRASEIIAAVEWCCARLRDPGTLAAGRATLDLSAIDEKREEGRLLVQAAKQMLAHLGKGDATAVTVEDVGASDKLFTSTTFNGDGIITPESAGADAATAAAVADIIARFGALTDRNGKPGIDQAKTDAFFKACADYDAWWAVGEASSFHLDGGTAAGYAAFTAVRAKIDDFFLRSRLAGFDPQASSALEKQELDAVAAGAAAAITEKEVAGGDRAAIARLPLQALSKDGVLDLGRAVNPAWAVRVGAFVAAALKPLGTPAALDEAAWAAVVAHFTAYEAWMAARQGAEVEPLGIARVRALRATGAQAAINALIARDVALKPEVAAFEHVERLVRYHRDLGKLLRNFVNFADFYDLRKIAIFQVGTLYIDQRSCTLCLRVEDAGKHMVLGTLGKVYIAYCTCTRADGTSMAIAACITQGDGDYLMPGRNGIFYDHQGRDWDATVTAIIDNPISIRQAFWSPYKKFVRFIEDQIAKRAAAADDAANSKLQNVGTMIPAAPAAGAKPGAPASGFDVGTIAALGVGLGAIGTAVGAVLSGILGLGMWMPVGFIGVILVISGPSMLIAWLKLRQRTLGPILEATGWAINGRVKINIPLGSALTGIKRVPLHARRLLHDPFDDVAAQRQRRLSVVLAVLMVVMIAVMWYEWHRHHKKLERWLEGEDALGSATAAAPASPAPAPAK